MTQKFRNKYRIPSTRLQNWDYGWNASYFVTICTHKRKCYFGEVVNGNMILSEIGKMAEKCWMEIPNHFPFVKLDAHVVMPNHVHGIIIIDKPDGDPVGIDAKFCVSAITITTTTIIAPKQIWAPIKKPGINYSRV
jgi:putative transposase